MKIHIPNSAHLGNIEGFLGRYQPNGQDQLELSFNDRWVSVHPFVIAMTACAGAATQADGGQVIGDIPQVASLRYLSRMKLFDVLRLEPGLQVAEHEAAGRFIPVTQIRTTEELRDFIIDMIPLLHASPEQADPIKYVMSELLRNALEHSRSSVGAFVCAQYFRKKERLAIGVADAGIGVLGSMGEHHPVETAGAAISLALRPGITGTTSRPGGTEYNAGAGLFFIKAIATTSRNFFVAYSGDALFKLRKGPANQQPVIRANPAEDYATRREGLPEWNGTVMGIDISLANDRPFQNLLADIRNAYHVDLKSTRKAKYKKPRFG